MKYWDAPGGRGLVSSRLPSRFVPFVPRGGAWWKGDGCVFSNERMEIMEWLNGIEFFSIPTLIRCARLNVCPKIFLRRNDHGFLFLRSLNKIKRMLKLRERLNVSKRGRLYGDDLFDEEIWVETVFDESKRWTRCASLFHTWAADPFAPGGICF